MAVLGGDQTFGQELKAFFGADRGAFSVVTPTEAGDGQVTLTGEEKSIALNFFGQDELDKYRGNDSRLDSLGLDARREFRYYPTGKSVFPKLKYPKPEKNELRLYFNEEEFKVTSGELWGIFLKNNEIWICSFSQKLLEALKQDLPFDNRQLLEPETDNFQAQMNAAPPEQVVSQNMQWKRNPKIAADVLKARNYACEIHPDYPSFISKATGNPFMEAHHLVPMKLQPVFQDTVNLDNFENICVLNPLSHRMLHHGTFEEIVGPLNTLIETRREFIRSLDLVSDDILAMYR